MYIDQCGPGDISMKIYSDNDILCNYTGTYNINCFC